MPYLGMKNYSIEEIRSIAAETGDSETIARFETYIANGWVGELPSKIVKKVGKFKPMLALSYSIDKIKSFPKIASFKYDGVRGILHEDFGLISRDNKPIANRYIRETLEALGVHHLDGEIITYTNGKQDPLNIVTSKVNSEGGEPKFLYFVFDDFEFPEKPYLERLDNARKKVHSDVLGVIPTQMIRSKEELIRYEEKASKNSEGLIVRGINAAYKNGRSTAKEEALLKIKRFEEDEGIILEVNQISTGLDMVGSLVLSWRGVIFNLGNGWDDEEAKYLWSIRHLLKGNKVTFKFEGIGAKGAPKFATYRSLRSDV